MKKLDSPVAKPDNHEFSILFLIKEISLTTGTVLGKANFNISFKPQLIEAFILTIFCISNLLFFFRLFSNLNTISLNNI
jgi:hypothetical protein